jgi:YD repeat-containing protein
MISAAEMPWAPVWLLEALRGPPSRSAALTIPTLTQTWTLDALGNWTETDVDSVAETRKHNSVNELTSRAIGQDPQINLTHGDAGNLTLDGSTEGDHQYAWDYYNRLVEAGERGEALGTTTVRRFFRDFRLLPLRRGRGGLEGG